MKKSLTILFVLLLCSLVLATKAIPYGATEQHFTVVMHKSSGAVNPGITVTTLDFYAVKDNNAVSTKVDLTAATCKDRGYGIYDVDIPDSWTNGTWATYGDCVTFILDDVNTANPFQYAFYEIQISPPADITSIGQSSTAAANQKTVYYTDFATDYNTTTDMWNTDVKYVLGEAPMDDNAITAAVPTTAEIWAEATREITGGTIDTYADNTPQTGDAYAVVVDSNNNTEALMADLKVLILAVIADTNAVDTATEMKARIFGADQNGITANVWTSTKAGYLTGSVALASNLDIKLSDVNTVSHAHLTTMDTRISQTIPFGSLGGVYYPKVVDPNAKGPMAHGESITANVDPNTIVDKSLTGHDTVFSLSWWLKRAAAFRR
jgi:hypothetical protein